MIVCSDCSDQKCDWVLKLQMGGQGMILCSGLGGGGGMGPHDIRF